MFSLEHEGERKMLTETKDSEAVTSFIFCSFTQVLITSVFSSPRAHEGFLVFPGPSPF